MAQEKTGPPPAAEIPDVPVLRALGNRRSIRYFDLDPLLKEKMQATVEEIRSGAFAKEWSSDREGKLEIIRMARQMQKALPMTEWEERTRRLFRIGDAAKRE